MASTGVKYVHVALPVLTERQDEKDRFLMYYSLNILKSFTLNRKIFYLLHLRFFYALIARSVMRQEVIAVSSSNELCDP